jgi:hypothetical protein
MSEMEGGCFCGAIRYRLAGPFAGVRACYCRKCQYMSAGGPNYALMAAKSGFVLLKGAPRRHVAEADSGNPVARVFCGDCGTFLYSDSPAYDVYPIRVGTLDDPSEMKPQVVVWAEAAQPWHLMDPDVPAYPRGVPAPS